MAEVHIEWLSDSYDCDTCGLSYSEGAVVTIKHPDRVEVLNMEPSAHCYGGCNYEPSDVFMAIIEALGHKVTDEIHE